MAEAEKSKYPSVREQLIANDLTRCVHFTGTVNETCKAGVNYRAVVGGPDLGWGTRLPCHGVFEREGVERVGCEHLHKPTLEEAERRVDESERRMAILALAHKAAKDDARAKGFKKGHGGVGELACPICDGGRLRYSVAGYNGHMHAACSTKGCASWME